MVNGVTYDFSVGEAGGGSSTVQASGSATEVKSELAARVFKLEVKVGATIAEGDLILVLEALKMEIEVRAPVGGVIQDLPVAVGGQVALGDTIAVIAAG